MTARGKWLYAELEALPGSEKRVHELVSALIVAVRAEPGCLRFEAFTRADSPVSWVVFEHYVDEAAFRAHLASSHTVAFNAELAAHVAGGASSLTWLDPVEV